MRIFSPLYRKAMQWSAHPHAPRYLGAVSFAESSFFPVPPDVMLAPMVLAKPQKAWNYATLTTLASVLGGIAGYYIGVFLYGEVAAPLIELYGAQEGFHRVQEWFARYGIWVVFLAGFTPIPYKIFTIAAGVTSMALAPFVAASLIGRGARFFLVAGLLYWGGKRISPVLESKVDHIGWAVVVAAVVFYLVVRSQS